MFIYSARKFLLKRDTSNTFLELILDNVYLNRN